MSAEITICRFWSTSALKVWKNSSCVEVLAADELHVVDHQQIDRAELLLEVHRRLEAQCPDELVHEFLGRQVDHLAVRGLLADMPGDRMHQMGLAEPDAAVEEQRVERHRVNRAGASLGDPPGGGMGQFVGFADDEVLEGEARVERQELRPVVADLERRSGFSRRRQLRLALHFLLAPTVG